MALTAELVNRNYLAFSKLQAPQVHTNMHTHASTRTVHCHTKTAGFGYDSFGLFVGVVEKEPTELVEAFITDTVYKKKLQKDIEVA